MVKCFTKLNKNDEKYIYCLTGTQEEKYKSKKQPKKKTVPKKEEKKSVPKKEEKKSVPKKEVKKKESKKPSPPKESKNQKIVDNGVVDRQDKLLRLQHIDKIKTLLKKVLSQDLDRNEFNNYNEELDIAIDYEKYLNQILRVDTDKKINSKVINFIEKYRKKK